MLFFKPESRKLTKTLFNDSSLKKEKENNIFYDV